MTTKRSNGIYPPSRDPGSEKHPACCAGSVGDSEVLRLLISCHCDSQRHPLAGVDPARPGVGPDVRHTPAVTKLAAGTRMVLAAASGSPGGPMNILLPHNRRKRDSGGPLEVSFSPAVGLAGAEAGWPRRPGLGGRGRRAGGQAGLSAGLRKRHFIL